MTHDHQWNRNFVSDHWDCRCGGKVSREEFVERYPDGPIWETVPTVLLNAIWDEKAAAFAGLLAVEISNAQLRDAGR